jgi:hypothetical protein
MPGMFCQSPEFCEKIVFVKGTDNQFSELFHQMAENSIWKKKKRKSL